MKSISTKNAPAPAGHYAQAITYNGLVYVSGQLPVNPHTGEKQRGDIADQARQVLENIASVLLASNSNLQQVLRATVYISDIALWDQVNAVYADFFGEHKPARSIVPTRDLHFGFKVEMDVIAVTQKQENIRL